MIRPIGLTGKDGKKNGEKKNGQNTTIALLQVKKVTRNPSHHHEHQVHQDEGFPREIADEKCDTTKDPQGV